MSPWPRGSEGTVPEQIQERTQEGVKAMKRKYIETVEVDGEEYETTGSASIRYGVSSDYIYEHLGKELFRAKDPRTGIKMVCGALPPGAGRSEVEGHKDEDPVSMAMQYIFWCPTDKVLPNLVWGGFWLFILCSLIFNGHEVVGGVIGGFIGVMKIITSVAWDKTHPVKERVVYVGPEMYGGGGLFDEVSSARKADIDFLLGRD